MSKTKSSFILLISVLLIGSVMRSPINALPLILPEIANAVQVSATQLGILTSIPLVIFLVLSNFVSSWIAQFGIKKILTVALSSMSFGALLRLTPNFLVMVLGTVLIGFGIAILNVLMPSLVATYFPNKKGFYTSLYSLFMMLGTSVTSLSVRAVADRYSWQGVMWVLLIWIIGVALIWTMAAVITPTTHQSAKNRLPKLPVWNQINAWPFLFVFGSQSVMNYTVTAWFPLLMTQQAMNSSQVSLVMFLYSVTGLPLAILIPNILSVLSQKGELMLNILFGLIGIGSAVGMLFSHTNSVLFWSIEGLMIGVASGYYFLNVMTMFGLKTKTPVQTATIAGMAQSGGYVIAALGPILYGQALANHPEGNLQNWAFVLLAVLMLVMGVWMSRIRFLFD